MKKQKIWKSIDEIFNALNLAGCNYIVMRNFECFKSGQVFVNGHDDIDLLCDDIKKVQKVLDTRHRYLFPTVNSYYIQYNDLIVHVDIRFIGDGYYDTLWQKEMLKKKVLFNKNIYVIDSYNYFYSLIYHAILQKRFLTEEYLDKLLQMAYTMKLTCTSEKDLMRELFIFMKKKHYKVTITKDPAIILNFKNIKKTDISMNYFWLFKRKILDLLKKNKRIGKKYV